MNTQEIVQKLWNLCNVLRDDGITYHQYVTEMTYILFLKMMKETEQEKNIPEEYRWDKLVEKEGVELMRFYRQLLLDLGTQGNTKVRQIYANASTNITAPANLKKIVSSIDELDWFSAKEEGLGDLYEGLLEKNANEKKSGAGQYFTPRPLINVMVKLLDPQPGERCNDPAAGTFGFMISADQHVRSKVGDYYDLGEREADFQRKEAFSGCELVQDTHRLALMNAMLHAIEGEILLGDSLSNMGKSMGNMDVILTNPPFGTKKGGERPTRDDLTFSTSNKQLNFLQHIYRALKPNDKARAAVVLPDNVLFQDGDGQKIRADLMDKCDLHTILRLPTGIFYAQGVKTNVLFFSRSETDKGYTKEVWFYDLRTNMPSFGKRTPLTEEYFDGFVKAYQAVERSKVHDERWSVLTREQIREKGDNLDWGLIGDDTLLTYEGSVDPIEIAEDTVAKLGQVTMLIESVLAEIQDEGEPFIISDADLQFADELKGALVPEEDQPYTIPNHWIWVKIGHLSKVIGGGTPKSTNEEFFENGTIPWITPADLTGYEDMYIEEGKRNITELGLKNSAAKLMPKNSIIFSSRAPIGYVAIAKNELCTNQGFKSFVPSKYYIPQYGYWYLKSAKQLVEKLASGTTFAEVSGSKIAELSFPLPPIAEQEVIVKKVGVLLGKLREAEDIMEDLNGESKSTVEGQIQLLGRTILSKAMRGMLSTNYTIR